MTTDTREEGLELRREISRKGDIRSSWNPMHRYATRTGWTHRTLIMKLNTYSRTSHRSAMQCLWSFIHNWHWSSPPTSNLPIGRRAAQRTRNGIIASRVKYTIASAPTRDSNWLRGPSLGRPTLQRTSSVCCLEPAGKRWNGWHRRYWSTPQQPQRSLDLGRLDLGPLNPGHSLLRVTLPLQRSNALADQLQ